MSRKRQAVPEEVERVRGRVRVHAAALLALPRGPLGEVVRLRMADGQHEVGILLGPGGATLRRRTAEAPGSATYPGQHLGPEELPIWNALGGGPLISKEIAAALGQSPSPRLRLILALLLARGVIRRAKKGGYERCPTPR